MKTVRVLKLGGSLLLIPDWPQRLKHWMSAHPASLTFLIVGGGEIVESVRRLDAQHHLSPSFSHWLCIDLLSATAQIAAQLLPEFPLITTTDELQNIVRQQRSVESATRSTTCVSVESDNSLNYLVVVSSFYGRPSTKRKMVSSQPSTAAMTSSVSRSTAPLDSMAVGNFMESSPLPENWDTTSDAIAAWLTHVVGAQQLVLFKSTTPAREHKTPKAWREQGIVDAAFAQTLPDTVSVQIVNLLTEESL